jgi:acetyl esterase/lipase
MASSTVELHPELQTIAGNIPRVTFSRANLWLFRFFISLMPGWNIPKDILVENRFIPSQGKKIRLRVYKPKNARPDIPCLLWIHGGGYLIGRPELNEAYSIELVQKLEICVVAVAYHLAPEHPFPTPLEDCYTALKWIATEAKMLGIDKHRIVIGGESAGGGLAAALAQVAYDRNEVKPVFQLLIYPMLDDRTVNQPELQNDFMVWNQTNNRFGWESYLGANCGAADLPDYAVPARRTKLEALPPAWIGVGSLDLFYNEDLAYAQRLQAAGVDCHLEIVQGAFHGFDSVASKTQLVRKFRDSQIAALKKYI